MEDVIEQKTFLVIGDIMLDTYYNGKVERISPEAPVPIFIKKNTGYSLGGAANVAMNLKAAGQNAVICSICGADQAGDKLSELLIGNGIGVSLLERDEKCTTEKIRFLAAGSHQIFRMDIEDKEDISDIVQNRLIKAIKGIIKKIDMVVLSDYMKGLLTEEFTRKIIACCNKEKVPVIADVKDKNVRKYENAFLLKPNEKELKDLTGMDTSSDMQVASAAQVLRKRCNCKYILATLGARGMILVGDQFRYQVPADAKEVYDVTGAGDTVISYMAAALANGISIKKAVDIANSAAGIQVAKVGTSPVSLSEVNAKAQVQNVSKLLNASELNLFRKCHRDKTIVFTNGCFDILHVGHISYLRQASEQGDILIVGLNSDDSVRRLKGDSRPINNVKDRAEMLMAYDFIDYVVIFEDDTPYEIIEKLQPDVLIKGGDYSPKDIVGADIVENRGGQVMILPFIENRSTSTLIEKVKNGK